MMKNISLENKNTKGTCDSWEEIKKIMAELETKGLAADSQSALHG